CSRGHVEGRCQLDILTHRVPHRAVLVARQRDRALNGRRGHVAPDMKVEFRADDARWVLLRTMSTTSADMQPASPKTSICTGEGPALLSPSTTVVIRALVASKRSASVQTRSATTGGFAIQVRL